MRAATAETRVVFVAYTNSDCTEGRGHDIPIAVCASEATAIRHAKRSYVQGSNGPVAKLELVKVDGKWYVPLAAVHVIPPTAEDAAEQLAIETRRAALDKAKSAGLTDDDIQALRT